MKHFVSNFFKILLLTFSFLYILTNPFQAAYHCRKGLEVCAHTAIPSLFIFIVLSSVLSALLRNFSLKTKRSLKDKNRIFNPMLIPIYILGLTCGAIPGSVALSQLYNSSAITKEECECTLYLFSGCSAPFIISVCGAQLGDLKLSLFLLISSHLASLTSYIILCKKISYSTISFNQMNAKKQSIVSTFTESISSSANICLNMCSFIIFFSIISGIITDFVIGHVSDSSELSVLIYGFFEVTGGITKSTALSGNEKLMIIASLVGFCGLSIQMQVSDILNKVGISSKKYTVSRFICMLLCPLYLLLILLIFPYDVMCFANFGTSLAETKEFTPNTLTNVFFILLSTATSIVFIFIDKYHKKSR